MRAPRLLESVSAGSIIVLVVALAILIAAEIGDDDGGGAGGADTAADSGDQLEVRVDRVVDGDTVEVRIDGRTEDVRYIGIDTPESVKPDSPVECYGPQASDFNHELVEGRTVRMQLGEEPRDQYDRLLVYVRLGDTFVNAELIRRGYATTLTIPPNDRYAGLFAKLEREASAAGRGLWGEC